MIKTKMLGKYRASRRGVKQKLSLVHSLRSASTSLVTSDMSKYQSSITLSALPNRDAVFHCPSEAPQDALCVARCPVCTASFHCFLETGSSNSLFNPSIKVQTCILACQSKNSYSSFSSFTMVDGWMVSSHFSRALIILVCQWPLQSAPGSFVPLTVTNLLLDVSNHVSAKSMYNHMHVIHSCFSQDERASLSSPAQGGIALSTFYAQCLL